MSWKKILNLPLLLLLAEIQSTCASTHEQYALTNATGGANYVSGYGVSENDPHRIVGGHPISVRRAPWQVALINRGRFICGGSIIGRYWVLTAAHCVTDRGPYSIRSGTRFFKSGGTIRRVATIVTHSRYSSRSSRYDIAMLRLAQPLTFRRSLRPVRLARRQSKLPRYFTVSGWGAVGERSSVVRRGLQRVRVDFVPKTRCSRSYRARRVAIPRRTICSSAPGKDSCYGDSGGALVHGNVQYGIVSFGIGCARARYPGVYTDVRRYRKWIIKVAKRY